MRAPVTKAAAQDGAAVTTRSEAAVERPTRHRPLPARATPVNGQVAVTAGGHGKTPALARF